MRKILALMLSIGMVVGCMGIFGPGLKAEEIASETAEITTEQPAEELKEETTEETTEETANGEKDSEEVSAPDQKATDGETVADKSEPTEGSDEAVKNEEEPTEKEPEVEIIQENADGTVVGAQVVEAVLAGDTQYAVTTEIGANGTITDISASRAYEGASVTFKLKPNSGYAVDNCHVESLTTSASNPAVSYDSGSGKYRFTMPASKVKICATFKASSAGDTTAQTETQKTEKKSETTEATTDTGIATGDTNDIGLYASIGMAAILLACVLVVRRREQE